MKENIFHSAQMERSRFQPSLTFRVMSLSVHTFSSNNTTGLGEPFEFRGGGERVILTNIMQAYLYQNS